MSKLSSWEELKQYKENVIPKSSLLQNESDRIILAVGEATCGIAAGAKKIAEVLQEEIDKQGIKNVEIIATGCYGYCYAEPMVEVRTAGKSSIYYGFLTEESARDIITKHIAKDQLLESHILPVEVVVP